ncbi:hypothetical protein ACFC5Z_32160 [Streptomyces sp. NPDC056004]|uniref:hypothetical protein n=1 Tax=unclassified Streptomyces TaxID=2593676 RepID=UPI0035DE8CA3
MTADPYSAALPLPWETLSIIRLLETFGEARPLGPPTSDERHKTLLRTAELLDRLALTEPDDRALDIAASRAGNEPTAFDRLNNTEGNAGKGDVGYVHQARIRRVDRASSRAAGLTRPRRSGSESPYEAAGRSPPLGPHRRAALPPRLLRPADVALSRPSA